jgi:DinB superfamily
MTDAALPPDADPVARRRAIRDAFAWFTITLADTARDAEVRVRLGATETTPDGEWEPREVVRHLIAVDREVWSARLDQLDQEAEPRWAWVEPRFDAGPADRPLETLLYQFAAGREALIERLDDLDDAGWARVGIHATFGRLDVAGLIAKAVEHDREHLEQLDAISPA